MPIAAVTVPALAPCRGHRRYFFRCRKTVFICPDVSLSISLKMRLPRIMAVSSIPPREQSWAELHPSSWKIPA
jgi:hypothetical protein